MTTEVRNRCDEYRDMLETWTEWWNNVGRANFTSYILPPLTETGKALACDACKGIGWYELQESPVDRCQVCSRRLFPK